jgi:hypothetical protein
MIESKDFSLSQLKSYLLLEILCRLHNFFVMLGVVVLKIDLVLIEKLKPLDKPSIELAHQEHYLDYLDDTQFIGVNDIILYVLFLQLLVKFVQLFHQQSHDFWLECIPRRLKFYILVLLILPAYVIIEILNLPGDFLLLFHKGIQSLPYLQSVYVLRKGL